MIYGETRQQRRQRMAIEGERRFAYLPTQMSDERTVWLEWYWAVRIDCVIQPSEQLVFMPTREEAIAEAERRAIRRASGVAAVGPEYTR